MKYIADGATITNRLLFLDGRVKDKIMGGGGFYAYTALRMCTDDCLFLSSVGKDFDDFYGDWFEKNRCSREGLFVRLEKTMFNDLKYFPDGSYIEYSIYGKKYTDEQLADMRKSGLVFLGEEDPVERAKQALSCADVVPFMDDAKGIYTQIPSKKNPFVGDMYTECKSLANFIQTCLIAETGARDRGLRETDTVATINWSEIPVAVLQLGFMTNEEEDKLLWKTSYQDKLVKGICDGIDAYFGSLED